MAGRFLFGKIDIHNKITTNNEENKDRTSVTSTDGGWVDSGARDSSLSISSSIKHYSIKNIE